MSDADATVLARREGAIGTVLMNRPRALNALDLGMIRGLRAALDAWRDDGAVRLVLLEGAGGKAFCAGGDIRGLRDAAAADDATSIEAFFSAEFALNRGIARFGKPWVSFIDGVCMGGGIGVSVHNGPRIATENALLAMPETAIGFFPDVGTSHVLPRLPDGIGVWLALTGARLKGADAVHAGLATHFVPRARVPELRAALVASGDASAVDRFAQSPPPAAGFEAHRDAIRRCFGAADTVPAILRALEAEGTDWAAEQAATLRRMSPTSLFVSLESLRRGSRSTLEECLERELALTRTVAARHPDFREGVRAVLVDKDNAPSWSPPRIEDVDPAAIRAMFSG
jgi:enoyl-CoA hydratase/carnithine racemase